MWTERQTERQTETLMWNLTWNVALLSSRFGRGAKGWGRVGGGGGKRVSEKRESVREEREREIERECVCVRERE